MWSSGLKYYATSIPTLEQASKTTGISEKLVCYLYLYVYFYMRRMWLVDQMLSNGREINNYTVTLTRQQPVNSNRGTVFSVLSVPTYYKQDKLFVSELVKSWLVSESVSYIAAGVQLLGAVSGRKYKLG
jgi:hypothetical protein